MAGSTGGGSSAPFFLCVATFGSGWCGRIVPASPTVVDQPHPFMQRNLRIGQRAGTGNQRPRQARRQAATIRAHGTHFEAGTVECALRALHVNQRCDQHDPSRKGWRQPRRVMRVFPRVVRLVIHPHGCGRNPLRLGIGGHELGYCGVPIGSAALDHEHPPLAFAPPGRGAIHAPPAGQVEYGEIRSIAGPAIHTSAQDDRCRRRRITASRRRCDRSLQRPRKNVRPKRSHRRQCGERQQATDNNRPSPVPAMKPGPWHEHAGKQQPCERG